jgi:ATP-dependent RNA helicase SUPV3L1/SUV3
MPLYSLPPQLRARGVTAVLGPTNTGKTHYAIERMLGHSSGAIGLPLRLLAREVYGRIAEKAGVDSVALITGEEKIRPPGARYTVATSEALPRDLDVAFLAVDEVQLAVDMDRGHIFTDLLLNRRGREETLLIGSATMRGLIETLVPGVNVVSRPRLSRLSFAGEKKVSRLPPRSAIVAFSAEEVYAIAELLRRQRGGAAVVLGALSPRTRNAQVELFQSGDVDHIVATDAIGMGLNLDIHHVAFAADRKFDGHIHRKLTPAEFGQIAGRAGRHLRDGTFGTSGRAEPFDAEMVQALEEHSYQPVRMVNWRNPDLDLSSLDRLRQSLAVAPREPGLVRAPRAEDEVVLDIATADHGVRALASGRDGVRRLWEVCALPDYRKVAPQAHAEVVAEIFTLLREKGHVPDDWFSRQLALVDRTEGDIDTLSARIAQCRTWSFCANRDWLREPLHWQQATRAIEDRLSDALHERLTARFVDRRTSVLMRRLRENAMLEAEVTAAGDVRVEGHTVGRLEGFRFTPDSAASGPEAKALQLAAQKSLAGEIDQRAARLSVAKDEAFALALDGAIRWQGETVAKIQASEGVLAPRFLILADEQLTGGARDIVEQRLTLWLASHVTKLLGPLQALETGEGLEGIGRGVAFQVAEHLGVLDRALVARELKDLSQEARGALRKLGLRFGAYHVYVPALLKPAPRALAAQLWALKHAGLDAKGLDEIAHLSSSGRTSFPADPAVSKALYRAAGFRVCGPRAIRVDILERLADLIRPAIAWKPDASPGDPPAGAHLGDGFTVTVAMTSLAGCAGEDFAGVLRSLGYRSEQRPAMPPPPPRPPAAPTEPLSVVEGTVPADPEPTDGTAVAEVAKSDGVAVAALPEPEIAPVLPHPDDAVEAAAVEVEAAAPAEEPPPAVESLPAAEGEAPDAGPAAVPVVMVEVWRPGRAEGQGRDHRRDGVARGRGPRRVPPGETAGEAGGPRGEQRFPRRDRRPQPQQMAPAGPGGERPDGEAAAGSGDRPHQARGDRPEHALEDRPRFDKPRFERHRGGKPGFERPRDGDRGPRPPGKDGGHRGGLGQQRFEPPRRQERQADPDSPFAALAALKAQLESQGKK